MTEIAISAAEIGLPAASSTTHPLIAAHRAAVAMLNSAEGGKSDEVLEFYDAGFVAICRAQPATVVEAEEKAAYLKALIRGNDALAEEVAELVLDSIVEAARTAAWGATFKAASVPPALTETAPSIREARAMRWDLDRQIGKRLRNLRRQRGVSQEKLAKMLGLTGAQIQKYEDSVNHITAGTLARIADVIGVPVAQFFERR